MKKIFTILLVIALATQSDSQPCFPVTNVNGNPIANEGYITYGTVTLCQGIVDTLSTYFPNSCGCSTTPSVTTWSTGAVGDTIMVTTSGLYTATIKLYCSNTDSFVWLDTFNIVFVNENIIANPGSNQTLPGCGTVSLGGNPEATGGIPPYQYSWSPSTGLSDPTSANPVVSDIYSATTYTLTVTDAIVCQGTNTVTITPILTAPVTPVVTVSGCELSCQIEPNFTYQWYYNYGSESHVAIPNATAPAYSVDSGTGYYYVVISSTVYPLCSDSPSLQVYYSPYQNQQICIVTLDSSNTYNQIVWDNTPGEGIDKFRIYKESDSTSQFVLLNEQAANQFSTYTDSTSIPSQLSASYAISIVDSCGNESQLSPTHTTILLSSNLGLNNTVNLSWNAYVGFTYGNFEIWRSANGVPMTLLSTVANNTYAYIDNTQPTDAYYQIRVTNPNGCNPSRSASDYSTVRSNIVNNLGVGINNLNSTDLSMEVYPNPSNGNVNLKLGAQTTETAKLHIIDVLGRLVKEQSIEIKPGDNNVNFSIAVTGTYCIEILDSSNDILGNKIFIIE